MASKDSFATMMSYSSCGKTYHTPRLNIIRWYLVAVDSKTADVFKRCPWNEDSQVEQVTCRKTPARNDAHMRMDI